METHDFTPPYLPFKTFTNLFERLADNGIPNRIDRSTLSHLAGITQTYLLAALRDFGLTAEDGTPTDLLIRLVKEPDERHNIIADLVRTYYGAALALGSGATPSQLDEVFTNTYGQQGETRRKAITFFFNAATYGRIELSKHYKMPRGSGSSGNGGGSTGAGTTRRRRTTTRRRTGPDETPPLAPTTSVDSLKTRYIDMLMKKAESQDDFDADLLDRIESLLGFGPEADEDEPED
ncbi:MAG TPA: DUF5343 domain-containing protein [Gaiellaceae bacterium]|nr:DUF5343 domain-containing protein [Gaiellaceae bacterium]